MSDLKMPVMPADLLNDEVLKHIGPWSMYGLAETALKHYFPEEYHPEGLGVVGDYIIELGSCKGGTAREAELLHSMGFDWWQDVVKKYQIEVGYDAPDGFNEGYVNEN